MLTEVSSNERDDVIESMSPIAGNGGSKAMESHVPHCGTIVGSNRVRELKAPAWKKHANIIRKNDNIHAKMAPPV